MKKINEIVADFMTIKVPKDFTFNIVHHVSENYLEIELKRLSDNQTLMCLKFSSDGIVLDPATSNQYEPKPQSTHETKQKILSIIKSSKTSSIVEEDEKKNLKLSAYLKVNLSYYELIKVLQNEFGKKLDYTGVVLK